MTYQSALSRKPFPGLRSFQKHESDIFFGRDDHVDEMLAKLGATHFLCVTGPSGCGKSSLARTGLLNGLDAGFMPGTGSNWIFCDFRPGGTALENLCSALATALTGGANPELGGEAAPGDAEPGSLSVDVAEYLENHIHNRSIDLNDALDALSGYEGQSILILVDQFEELFRYAQSTHGSAAKFVELLLQTSAARQKIYVVITIRTDELEKCARYPGLTRAINDGQFLTPTLDRFQVQQAIEGPLALFGGTIASDLSIWLLNSLDDELDKLPLMQHALQHLYDRKLRERTKEPQSREEITITLDDFRSAFGIDPDLDFSAGESRNALRQSLSTRLDQIYAGTPDTLKRGVKRIFCALTSIESRGRDIRNVVPLSRLAEIIGHSASETRAMLEYYSSGSGGDAGYVRISTGSDPQVDVTHECVLRLWGRLQNDWLVEEQRAADSIRDLSRRALHFEDSMRDAGWFHRLFQSDVLSGHALHRYESWFRAENPNSAWAAQYLEPMQAPGRSEAQPPRPANGIIGQVKSLLQASRRRRKYLFGLVCTATLSVVATIAYGVWIEFKAEERIASERLQVAVTSLNASDTDALGDPVGRIEESASTLGTVLESGEVKQLRDAAFSSTWIALSRARELRRFRHLLPEPAEVHAAAFSRDGMSAFTISSNGMFRQWSLSGPVEPEHVVDLRRDGSLPGGRSLKVSPSGTTAVIGFEDGAVILMDLGTFEWRELTTSGTARAHSKAVMDLAFSGDGDLLVTSSTAGELALWTAKDGGPVAYASELNARRIDWKSVYGKSVQWGTEDAAKGRDRTDAGIWSLDIAPGGRLLAFGLENGRICLLDLKPATTGSDIIDAPRNPVCNTHAAHNPNKTVKSLRFQPGRRTLVSGGNDDQVVVWALEERADSPAPVPRRTGVVLHHDSDIWDVDFGFDGAVLATASWDGAVRIFDTDTWRLLATFAGHRRTPRTLQFDHTSRKLLTSSLDGTARVWSPFTNRALDPARSHMFPPVPASEPEREILSVSFASKGDRIVFNERSRVWTKKAGQAERDLSTGSAAHPPTGAAFTQVAAHPDRDIVYAAMTLPVLAAWSRSDDGVWTATQLSLPGEVAWDEYRPLAISPSGDLLAVAVKYAAGSSILLCRLQDGLPVQTCLDADHPGSREIAYRAPDGKECFGENPVIPSRLIFSHDGASLIAGGSDCAVHLYDTATGNESRTLATGHDKIIFGLAVSTDGQMIASSSKASNSKHWPIRLWSLKDGSRELLEGHRSSVTGIRFLPGDEHLVSVSYDEDVRIWNLPDRKTLVTLSWHTTNIVGLDIVPTADGVFFAASSDGGSVGVGPLFQSAEQIYSFASATLKDDIGILLPK